MTVKLTTNLWPLYEESSGELMMDATVSNALEAVMGGGRRTEIAMKHVDMFRGMLRRKQASPDLFLIDGMEGILAALATSSCGKTPDLSSTHIGMSYVRIVNQLGRTDLLKGVVDMCRKHLSPGVIAGLSNLALTFNLDEGIGKEIDAIFRGPCGVGDTGQKGMVARSLIADYRRRLPPETDLDKAEDVGSGHPQHVIDGDVRTAVMWMLRDPYVRLGKYEFDWGKFPETVEAIRRKFPFALPSRLDLETRTADGIVEGLSTILTKFIRHRVVMDLYIVDAALKAFTRLMDMGGVTEEENKNMIDVKMLSFCLYMRDKTGFVKRILKRLPAGVKHPVTLYAPKYCPDDIMSVMVLLYKAGVVEKLSVVPMNVFEY